MIAPRKVYTNARTPSLILVQSFYLALSFSPPTSPLAPDEERDEIRESSLGSQPRRRGKSETRF